MTLNRRKSLRLVVIALVLIAVAVSMTLSTAAVDDAAGPFQIFSLPFVSNLI
jgi:hypothetical protein